MSDAEASRSSATPTGGGQIRFEILIDNGGTPSDPTDDEFLDDLGEVKGSTGRTDDFCEAVVPVLTD